MPSFLFLAIAMATPAGAPAPVDRPTPRTGCTDRATQAAADDRRVNVRPLAQQPDARPYLAVVREIDGCRKPVVVNDRVGVRGR